MVVSGAVRTGFVLAVIAVMTYCSAPALAQQSELPANSDVFSEFIPDDAEVTLVIDGRTQKPEGDDDHPGLNFTEGPSWIDGTLYFSNIDFRGGPGNSGIVAMNPDGSYRYVTFGAMLSNGTIPLGNGNLAVCNMFGHQIVEMTTDGEVVRVIAEKMSDGSRIDGPNDLVIDSKGGIYFTDPQYTPGIEHMQPGPTVNYVRPDGKVIRVIEDGEFPFPNGVLLSPDGKTLYVCNTNSNPRFEDDPENFIIAYTVQDDGTLTDKRRFAEMVLDARSLQSGRKSTGADGMTIDEEGNLYVGSNVGLQIFDSTGAFVGIVPFPLKPVNMCFGGPDLKTIYFTCNDRIYSLRTNKRGLVYPLSK